MNKYAKLKKNIDNKIVTIKYIGSRGEGISKLNTEINYKKNDYTCFIPFTLPDEVVVVKPTLSTTGGTSDARYIKDICPVYEFGSVGKTMHQINENIDIKDLENLQKIYEDLILSYNDIYG